MATKSLEERMASLEKEIERLQAVTEIQNLVGRYAVVHTPKTMAKSWELFALKQPDVSVEIAMWGVYVGGEKIKKLYATMGEGTPIPGTMFEHQFTTPIIEVARDGQTAKGLWFSPGHETPPVEGKPEARWCWGKYGADFIKEDGEWKIWHFHFYDTFMIPYDRSWVDTPQPSIDVAPETEAGLRADKPATRRSTYFPTDIREPMPWWPEPYQTWDGKSMA